jgi:hypothetical protein
MFLDNSDAVVLDEGDNILRAQVGTSCSVDVLSRPIHREVLRRDPMLEKENLDKGRPKEIQVVLGWTTNTSKPQGSLPYAKQRGRLNHAATVLPLAQFYLGRFYAKLKCFRNDCFYSIAWNASDLRYLR